MENSMKFKWHEEYSVDIEEIDNQHKKIIESINKLYNFIYDENSKDKFDSLIDDMENMFQKHFLTEEKYFDMFNYEFSEEHKAGHDRFFNKLLEVRDASQNQELNAAFKMAGFAERWLSDHMVKQDQKYVKCFKEHGLS